MKHFAKVAVAAVFIGAFVIISYGGSVDLPDRGVTEGSTYRVGCGDGKVMIGVRGKMGMFLGKLEALCRPISTEGAWLGSTTSSSESGGAGGIYPIVPQPFSITCPDGTAVEGLSGRFDGFVVRITINCFSQAPIASGIGVTRTISAPLHAGASTPWSEDRCPESKPARGIHGRFTTAGVRSIGLVCHSGTTPNREVLAAPDGLAAVNLTGPNGTLANTVTPFVQVSWMDRSTYESGFRLVIFQVNPFTSRTFERPAGTGSGTRQPVNITDLPAGNYLFLVCAKFSSADGGDRCTPASSPGTTTSGPFGTFQISQAATCTPTINTVFRSGAGQAVVQWSHPCANPIRFEVQLRTGTGSFINTLLPPNGAAREHSFQFVDGANHEVRVCPVFQGQSETAFCSAPRAFRFTLNG